MTPTEIEAGRARIAEQDAQVQAEARLAVIATALNVRRGSPSPI